MNVKFQTKCIFVPSIKISGLVNYLGLRVSTILLKFHFIKENSKVQQDFRVENWIFVRSDFVCHSPLKYMVQSWHYLKVGQLTCYSACLIYSEISCMNTLDYCQNGNAVQQTQVRLGSERLPV